jgi:hypothetical protein
MPKILPLHPSGEKVRSDQPVVEIDYKDHTIKIWYIFPGFKISNAKRNIRGTWKSFKEVQMSETGFLSIDQQPLLPCLRRFVQIPSGYEVDMEKWGYTRHHKKDFKRKLITWAEESLRDKGEVEFDDHPYNANRFNPKYKDIVDIVENNSPIYFYMNGYKSILVQVKPLQYHPRKRVLRGYGKIVVTIPLVSKRMSKKAKSIECALTDAVHNLGGYGNLLLNPNRKFFEPKEIAPSLHKDVRARRYGPEFLIIYDEKLRVPAEMLKNWKQKCGLLTKTVSIKKVGNSVSQIKDVIRSERIRRASRLRYVLLFGDVSKIPLSQQDQGIHTDHYFFTHKDPDDAECILPWVSGGRIPVDNLEDGMSVVNKIIRYEKEPPLDPDYYKRMTFAAYFQDNRGARGHYSDGRADRNFIKTMEDIRSHLIGQDFQVNRVYVSQSANPLKFRDGTPVPQEVKESLVFDEKAVTKLLVRYINEGQLIVGYRGHGEPEGWEKPALKNDDLLSITSDQPSIFFSINCLSGCFHKINQKAFAEKLLELHGGAPAIIASTETSWRWRNDSLIKALFDAIWPGLIPTYPITNVNYAIKYQRVGDILNYAKTYLLLKHGCDIDRRTKDQLELYHVIGDPTLAIWANEPYIPVISAGILGNSLYLKMSTCPRDAVLTIWHGDTLLKRIKPSSARLTIPLTSLTKHINHGDTRRSKRFYVSICLAAPGCRMVEEQVWF